MTSSFVTASALAALALAIIAMPAAAQQAPRALPQAMHGTWGYEAKSCTEETDDGRANVAARSVEFFASACTFTRFSRSRDGTWTVRGTCAEEGEAGTTPGSVSLRLLADGRLSIGLDGAAAHAYQRCAQAMRVR